MAPFRNEEVERKGTTEARKQDITNVLPRPNVRLANRPESAWERERRAFWELLPELRAKYDGQYVAIKDEKVVAKSRPAGHARS